MSATEAIENPRIVSRLDVGRWRNTFVVSEDFLRRPATHDVLRRIDHSIAEELAASCALRLGHYFADSGEGIWLIRELNLMFTVDLAKPRATDIAPEWSHQLAACLAQVIHRGADADEGVLYFASRAAYLAQFVVDLVGGRAWSKWYYDEFHSLAMLSPSRAIAEALTRETETGARALVDLAETGRLDEILEVLTSADARTVYQSCFPTMGPLDSQSAALPWIGRLLEVWNDTAPHPRVASLGFFHEALRWLTLMSLRFRNLEIDPVAYAALKELLELRGVLEQIHSPILADRLVRQLVEGTISLDAAVQLASEKGATSPRRALEFLFASAQGDSDWAVQAAAVLLKGQTPPVAAILTCESMVSNFAGMFLLGHTLVRHDEFLKAALDQGAKARNEPGPNEPVQKEPIQNEQIAEGRTEPIASFLRYLILVKCAGSPRTFDATCDTAMRLLSGCQKLSLRDGLEVSSFDLDRAYASVLRNLPVITECKAQCLLAETISLPAEGRELLVLRDVARNEWIHLAVVAPEAGGREQGMLAALDLIRESTGTVPVLLLHPSIAEMAASARLAHKAEDIVVLPRESYSEQVATLLLSTQSISGPLSREKYASWLSSAQQEFAYYSFANCWPEYDFTLDLLGVLLSRAAMRYLARRLMGFQASSPEHLYRNFLEGAGTVRHLAERIEVELPRCPLLLVLQLSGLTKQSYTVPWLEGKEVCLLPPKQ